MSQAPAGSRSIPPKTWAQFLEGTPPDTEVLVVNAVKQECPSSVGRGIGPLSPYFMIEPDDIQLHCETKTCGVDRTFSFKCTSGRIVLRGPYNAEFVSYECRNCQQTVRTFALRLLHQDGLTVLGTKFGEDPPYGPPVPARVVTLIGPDRELFLKGRRAELHGLGIGAFSYYRRVVENQTQRIFSELHRAAKHLHAADAVELLERAARETQFTRAVEMVKEGLPTRLWIQNENPLTLLHNAISNDLHTATDEECLEIATSIRTVLTELAARADEVTKEDKGLREAVTTLSSRPRRQVTIEASTAPLPTTGSSSSQDRE